ncbi:MAG TPA: hypothetical protein EYP59_03445 [Thiotrichaceae bacterium]|nr:hypothetical protein [Thiotrichaceae bacterium]
MKILVYDAEQIVPIAGLYEWLGDSGRIIFSNADQAIQDFDSREVIRLLESIDFDTVIFYIPSKIQDRFVELVNQQITHQWEEDNTVNVSIGDIGLIGNDQLSQFFDHMVLEKVVKSKGYETSEHEEGVRIENTVDATLNSDIVDKIAKAIEVGTQNQTQIMWKNSVFLTLLVVIAVIVAVIITPIWLPRMTTQPPFNEFHKIKTENAQFNITIEQKDKLLKQRENKLQELTIENDKKKTENLNLQTQVEITQEKITQYQKEVEQKNELLQQRENKLQELTTENEKKKTDNLSLKTEVKIKQNKIRLFQKEVEQKEELLQKTEKNLQGLTIASRKGQIQDLQKQLKKALEEIEFRKQFPTQLEQFLLQLESGDRIVIVVVYNSKEKAQNKVKQIKSQYPELFWVQKGTLLHNHFGDGIYQDGINWVVYIGGYYSSDSAQNLVTKAKNELRMPRDTYHQLVPQNYRRR